MWRQQLLVGIATIAILASAALVHASTANAGKFVDRVVGTSASGTTGGLFNNPRGVAVNDATPDGNGTDGWFYVADGSNHRIQAFNAAGEFQWAIGRNTIDPAATTDTDLGDVFEKCETAADCKQGVAGSGTGMFDDPMGLAINQATGDLYVRDRDNRRVQQFTADGDFVRMWGFDVIVATGPPPNSNGTGFEICDVTNGNVAADCKIGTAGAGDGQFGTSSTGQTGIAVQQGTGDVFVADPGPSSGANRRVQRFEADGTFLAKIGSNGAPFGSNFPRSLAVDGDTLYATSADTVVSRYDLDPGVFLPALTLNSRNTNDDALREVEIDPSTGNLLVAQVHDDLGTLIADLADPAAAATEVDRHIVGAGFSYSAGNGFALNPDSGDLIATAGAVNGHFIAIADDDGAPQADASVLPATAVGSTTATLHGEITTSDPLATNYRLEYSFNGVDWTTAGSGQVAGNASGEEVTATATGLKPNRVYRMRLVTSREFGNPEFESAELTFLTDAVPPQIADERATAITTTTARLQARINPHSTATVYRFEYGAGNFNTSIPVPDGPVGNGPEFVFVAADVVGLAPGTDYQFRVVATSASEGSTTTTPQVFTTAVGDASAGRGYELVSPADKVGAAGVGIWGGGMLGAADRSGYPAHRLERFAAAGSLGSVLLDSAVAYASDWAFSVRSAEKGYWVAHSPITHTPSNQQTFRTASPYAVSEDLDTVVWASSGNLLRVFPQLASWPGIAAHFVGDWSGRWELLVPTTLDDLHFPEGQNLAHSIVSKDGSAVVTIPNLGGTPVRAVAGGMAGPSDPSAPGVGDLQAGRAVYIDDVSAGLSDAFEGNGVYSNVGVCTGDAGPDRTVIPAVAGGDLAAVECPSGLGTDPVRDRLISSRGATIDPADVGLGGSAENAVSRDGSRVFFLSPDPAASGVPVASGCPTVSGETVCAPQLYVRQRNEDGTITTRWISRAEDALFGSQDATLTGGVRLAGASIDGDKVLFQTAAPLTVDDPNGACGAPCTTGTPDAQSWDLYLYDLPDGPDGDPATPDADPAAGTLTRISSGPAGSDCNVAPSASDAALRFLSNDATRAYFTCSAPLADIEGTPAGGTTTPSGTVATTDATNLYAYDASDGAPQWSFVARLPTTVDRPAGCATRDGEPRGLLNSSVSKSTVGLNASSNCVRGTAEGDFVTLWTTGALTPDDPDSTTVDGFAFDLDGNGLTRFTAPQGGVGGTYLCNPDFAQVSQPAVQCNADNGFGTAVQPDLGVATEPATPGDRIAFFQSRSRLVPEDTDDAYDVYEWRNGELNLLSTGKSTGGGDVTGTGGAFYKGNDVTGDDVYIATNDRLTWQDFDAVLDIYVARVGGGFPQPPLPDVCAVLADACHTAAAAPTTAAAPVTRSAPSGDGDASPGARKTLRVGKPSRKARRRAARTGNLVLAVRVSEAGKLTAVAKGRIGKRSVGWGDITGRRRIGGCGAG
jgi:hypothetical protein